MRSVMVSFRKYVSDSVTKHAGGRLLSRRAGWDALLMFSLHPIAGWLRELGKSSLCAASATAVPKRESAKLESFSGLPTVLRFRLEET
jgi:hypothetical protein